MKHFVLFTLLLISFNVTAQRFTTSQIGNLGSGGITQANDIEVKGSVYYSEEWLQGSIRSIDQVLFEDLTFRYNIKDQSLIIKLENDQVKIVKNRFINDFQFTDKAGVVHQFSRANDYTYRGKAMGGFVEIIHKGDFDLVYRYSSKFKPVENRPNYGSSDAGSPEYITQIDLLQAKDTKDLTAVRNKKELLELFEGKTAEMKAYFKKNKVKLRDFTSVKESVEHYQGL